MPLTEQMPHARAGVINHLSRALAAGKHAVTINDLQSEIRAGNDTIEILAANNYIVIKTFELEPTTRIGNAYWAATSRKGRNWVKTDPVNRLLVNVYDEPHRRLRLAHIAGFTRAEKRGLIVDMLESGLLTLHFAGDGQQTKLQYPHDGVAEFRVASDYHLCLTWDSRQRLAV